MSDEDGFDRFTVPRNQRYFEDYRAGEKFRFGPVCVEEDECIAFARRYDPQAMHVDVQAAQAGPYGGLIASGWLTMGLMMRLMVDHYVSTVAALASPGFDEVRWLRPVRPGEHLWLHVSILEARRSKSKPDRGIVVSRLEAVGEDAALAMSCRGTGMIRVREPQLESSFPIARS